MVLYLRSQGHLGFLLCSLFGSFIIVRFVFEPVIYFEFISVKDVRSVSRFFFFCVWLSGCSSTIYWKDYFCSMALPLLTYKYQLSAFIWVYFWTLYYVLLIDLSILFKIPYCHCYLIWLLFNMHSLFFNICHFNLP